jgi:hypothetical protein
MQISAQCMGVDNLWSQTHFIVNHTSRWNYNCAIFYIRKNWYFTSFIAKRDATGKQIFRVNVKETSTVCCVNLENNFSTSAKFTDVNCNCKQQLSQNS